jgi:surface protein
MYGMFKQAGYSNTNFTLDVSGFDTSKVNDMDYMFEYAGYNSTKLNTEITIRNPKTQYYRLIFSKTAIKPGTNITVNYTSETSSLVDKMIATRSSGSNVVKGVQVD